MSHDRSLHPRAHGAIPNRENYTLAGLIAFALLPLLVVVLITAPELVIAVVVGIAIPTIGRQLRHIHDRRRHSALQQLP